MEQLRILNGTPWEGLFYHSPIRTLGKPHRGGVPILFPQFAGIGPLRKHGYARDHAFSVESELRTENDVVAVYSLHVNAGDWSEWAHSVKLKWTIQANSDVLTFSLETYNIGQTAFEWTGGLHPYFAVSDLACVAISGFEGLPASDKFTGQGVEQASTLSDWRGQEFERHYLAPACVEISDPGLNQVISLKANGFSEWMVWNPGFDMARQLPDLPDNDWQKFICVEPIAGATPILMLPGHAHKGSLEVRQRRFKR